MGHVVALGRKLRQRPVHRPTLGSPRTHSPPVSRQGVLDPRKRRCSRHRGPGEIEGGRGVLVPRGRGCAQRHQGLDARGLSAPRSAHERSAPESACRLDVCTRGDQGHEHVRVPARCRLHEGCGVVSIPALEPSTRCDEKFAHLEVPPARSVTQWRVAVLRVGHLKVELASSREQQGDDCNKPPRRGRAHRSSDNAPPAQVCQRVGRPEGSAEHRWLAHRDDGALHHPAADRVGRVEPGRALDDRQHPHPIALDGGGRVCDIDHVVEWVEHPRVWRESASRVRRAHKHHDRQPGQRRRDQLGQAPRPKERAAPSDSDPCFRRDPALTNVLKAKRRHLGNVGSNEHERVGPSDHFGKVEVLFLLPSLCTRERPRVVLEDCKHIDPDGDLIVERVRQRSDQIDKGALPRVADKDGGDRGCRPGHYRDEAAVPPRGRRRDHCRHHIPSWHAGVESCGKPPEEPNPDPSVESTQGQLVRGGRCCGLDHAVERGLEIEIEMRRDRPQPLTAASHHDISQRDVSQGNVVHTAIHTPARPACHDIVCGHFVRRRHAR
eukprot:m.327525 g.327525  ORF g.327525 m.327525 type:complete len:550 (-) comp27683_c0_seq1:7258-8907(-)